MPASSLRRSPRIRLEQVLCRHGWRSDSVLALSRAGTLLSQLENGSPLGGDGVLALFPDFPEEQLCERVLQAHILGDF